MIHLKKTDKKGTMDLEELKAYRRKRFEEFNTKKNSAVSQLESAVESYRKHIGAGKDVVKLERNDEMSFCITVTVDDFIWSEDISLKFGGDKEKNSVYAVFDGLTEVILSQDDDEEFGKEINDRIVQAIDKAVSKYNKKLTVF